MKMELFCVRGRMYGWFFSLVLLWLSIVHVNGQQVGISLNNSLVDIGDLLYRAPFDGFRLAPTNARPDLHDQALLCVTDLVDCCASPRAVRGDWYYPDGHRVMNIGYEPTFLANRGPNQVINGQQFNGSVRLWRWYSNPPGRGCFYCKLPNAANPTLNQILYAYIVKTNMNISYSGSNTAGGNSTLVCSATITPDPLPDNIPSSSSLMFEWMFGPNKGPLPSGVIATSTNLISSNIFMSTLQFSPLSQSYAGNYTCQFWGKANLEAHTTLIVNSPPITVTMTTNLNPSLMVGQTNNTLTCDVSGARAEKLIPTITYQWTRSDGSTQTQVGTNSNTLSLSPLRLSDAGDYSCIIISTLLNNPVTAGNDQSVIIQVPDPQSVTVTSSEGVIIHNGSDVTLICSVRMNQNVFVPELSLLIVNAQLTRPDGSVLDLSNPAISGTVYNFITHVNSFGNNDIGNYTCMATVRPQPTSTYLTGTSKQQSSDSKALGTCSSEVGIAVGALILMEVIIAGVIVVLYWIVRRYRKSGRKSDFAVSTNMAYGQVKLDTLGDVGGEYEDHDGPVRSGQSGGGNYEPIGCPAPYELPVGKSAAEAPVYATGDKTIH